MVHTRIFALIIGIDRYQSGGIWDLHSCVDDATNVRNWLVEALNVPRSRVRFLQDNQATKRNIEVAFMDHLTNNPDIQQNDAIFIYFAGHGSSLPAPRGWYDQEITSPASVQLLCTYDHDTRNSEGGRIAGISDRSLRALVDDLASAKGNNITVMLDCSFSPAQAATDRGIVRSTQTLKATSDDLYPGLWSTARGLPRTSKLGLYTPGPSHVFLSACPPRGRATEGKDGGLFTSLFFNAMAELPLHCTSYSQVVDYLMQRSGGIQNFMCIGQHKDRVLFNKIPFTIDNQYSAATLEPQTMLFKIQVGALHGLVHGSEFSLHFHNYRLSKNPSFSNAVVSELHPTWCYARTKTQLPEVPKVIWAKVVRWNNKPPFRVKLKANLFPLFHAWNLQKSLPKKLGDLTLTPGLCVQSDCSPSGAGRSTSSCNQDHRRRGSRGHQQLDLSRFFAINSSRPSRFVSCTSTAAVWNTLYFLFKKSKYIGFDPYMLFPSTKGFGLDN